MNDAPIRFPLQTAGYIFVRPSAIRLVRTTSNAGTQAEPHFIQLNDGLEYEIFGIAKQTLEKLGWAE